jgi:hypothetical protein
MDLDSLLLHYFHTHDLEAVDADTMARGREQLALDFGIEQDPSRRFALWVLMEALGFAPSPDTAFKDPQLQEAAHAYRKAAWRMEKE